MPKMFIHAPENTFSPEARGRVAAALTELGILCERLADTPQIRAGVWVYFVEHAPDTVFRGGAVAVEPIISLKVYTLEGGLQPQAKTALIASATQILGQNMHDPGAQVPAYVVILEVPEEKWGMYGKPVKLAALQGHG